MTTAVLFASPLLLAAAVTVRPVDSGTGTAPVSVTFPVVIHEGTTTLRLKPIGPEPWPGHVLGEPSLYYDLTTTTIFEASSRDPITVCIDYSGVRFMNEVELTLVQYTAAGWADRTSLRDRSRKLLCGNVAGLGLFALVEPANQPPIVDAGPSQTLEATGPEGAVAELNGSATIDPDREALELEWRDEAERVVATTAVARRPVALGTHRLTLNARDPRGGTGSDSVVFEVRDTVAPQVALTAPANGSFVGVAARLEASVSDAVGVGGVQFRVDDASLGREATTQPFVFLWDTAATSEGPHRLEAAARDTSGNVAHSAPIAVVVDRTPPSLELSVTPSVLWPANHKFVAVTVSVALGDALDPNPRVTLESIACAEPPGQACSSSPNVEGASYGTDDREFQLQASRLGSSSGRVYTITYLASDAAGNTRRATATVTVPHDQGKSPPAR
jgi:hypothetical protein